jgi:hypothetical protein
MKTRAAAALLALLTSAGIALGQDGPGIAATSFDGKVAMSLAQDPKPADLPPWLADRGDGIRTSMFGTYVREHELLVYLFYEYTVNRDQEYKPEDLGFVGTTDFNAKRVDHELLVWAAYGLSENVMVEFESALWTRATQTKASQDGSAMPRRLSEEGVGDTEGQIRWRFLRESEGVPEITAFFEVVLPLQRSRVLIGTQDWQFEVGFVVTKGFSWGTITGRIAYAYDHADRKAELGEYAMEYMKKLSESWRLVVGVEGEQDEVSAIVELQWRPWPNVILKLNNAFGITSKAADWAPEIGIMISF